MFLVIKKVNDLEYLVLDTQDGVIEKVCIDDLLRAKKLGFKIKEDNSMEDYITILKSLTKANIMHTEITYNYKKDLYEKLKYWGSKVKSLPRLKDFNDYKLDLFAVDDYFVFVVNESKDPVFGTGDAYLFSIKENGIFGKVYKDSYLDVQGAGLVSLFSTENFGSITLNLLGVEVVTFNKKTAIKKRGRLSNVFASLLNKI